MPRAPRRVFDLVLNIKPKGANDVGFDWTKLRNYSLWVLVSSLALLLLQHAGVGVTAQAWNQLISGFMGLMVLLGLLNSPASAVRMMAYQTRYGGSSFNFHWTAILNYAFLVALIAYIPQALSFFGVVIDVVFYNQVALYILTILGALGILTGTPSTMPQNDKLVKGLAQDFGPALFATGDMIRRPIKLPFEPVEFDRAAIEMGTLQPVIPDKPSQSG
jgi:uncharacterized membrane protein